MLKFTVPGLFDKVSAGHKFTGFIAFNEGKVSGGDHG